MLCIATCLFCYLCIPCAAACVHAADIAKPWLKKDSTFIKENPGKNNQVTSIRHTAKKSNWDQTTVNKHQYCIAKMKGTNKGLKRNSDIINKSQYKLQNNFSWLVNAKADFKLQICYCLKSFYISFYFYFTATFDIFSCMAEQYFGSI